MSTDNQQAQPQDIMAVIASHQSTLDVLKKEMEHTSGEVEEHKKLLSDELRAAEAQAQERIAKVREEENARVAELRASQAGAMDDYNNAHADAIQKYRKALKDAQDTKMMTKEMLAAMGHTAPRGGVVRRKSKNADAGDNA